MLICKDCITGSVDGATVITALHDRVYLEYGPDDAVESFQKKGKNKAGDSVTLTWEGQPWTGTRPVKGVSKSSVQDLFNAAVSYIAEKHGQKVKDANGVESDVDPNLTLLGFASSSADLASRNAVTQATKGADPAKVRMALAEQMVKARAKVGKVITLERALAIIDAMDAE